MSGDELQSWCLEAGQSSFRGQQIFEWMYRQGISAFKDMSNVNKPFREYLENNCIIQTLEVKKITLSKVDKSTKILFSTTDKQFIETISMINKDRHTVCISSQAGCALNCGFCETGRLGLKRNLTTGEIVDQLIFVRGHEMKPITNVVFMGMGEPLHNYDNVISAADIFHSPKGFNLAATRITISTAGLLPQIQQFISEKQRYKLAISLNAAYDRIRTKIMPINKKWSIMDLIGAGKEYSNLKKRQVMFEYVLLKGINDSKEDAYQLAHILKRIPCKLNIIPYNETDGSYQRPDEKTIREFAEILHNLRDEFRVFVRWSKGQDIYAGCGQLAGKQK
jgi:23S rRNA (adenine2503-C2)-methyltransferase